MSDATPHLGLPLIAAAQAQKHVTHNQALGLLDALVQLACLDKDLSAPPASPAEGDRYLVTAANPAGAWAGLSGQVVRFQDGVWTGAVPRTGWFAYVIDETDLYVFDGSAWTSFRRAITAIEVTSRLGINTTPDATNRLALKSDAALLSWDDATPGSGSMRVAVNKQAAARDAGLIFQTGYSARALLGTLGSDDFILKVSGDGASFATALTASAATGGLDFTSTDTAIAAAAITDLGAAGTRRVVVSGAATITSLGASANRERFVRFSGAATLSHDAVKLVLPTRADILTAVDDTCIATSDASGNWRVRHYQRADGTPLAGGGGNAGGAVASVSGRTGAVTLTSADLSDATALGKGLVTATTAANARSSLSAASSGANGDITALSGLTTALSIGQGGTGATSAALARSGLGAAASGANTDITALSGPALGAATAVTAAVATNTTQVATTAFVAASFLTTASAAATYAPLASPVLTGTPTAPTAAAGTGTTQIATTAFVAGAVVAGASASVPLSRQVVTSGLATGGGDLSADRTITVPKAAPSDVAAGTDDSKALTAYAVAARFALTAPLASPALTGTPTAPNAAAGTNSAQVATTSFVAASFVTYAYAAASYATLASPTLTGTPAAPTPSPKDNSTKLATTAYADRGDAALTARTQVNDAPYAILPGDRTVAMIALTAPRTLTLPAASAYPQGATLTVIDESGACSAANTITLARAGTSDTVSGLSSAALVTAYGYLALQSNGANKWTIVDQTLVPNRRTFVDVALSNGSMTVGANFTRIPLAIVNQDTGGNWDATNNWYTCPRNGVYLIIGSLRVGPNGSTASEPSYQYGIGVYTAEQDGPWFLWHFTPPGTAIRSTYAYSRLSYQSAGDRLRMFSYSDQGVVVNVAGLQIVLACDAV